MGNREIHYRYGILLLFLVIILITALAYFDVPNLVDKFSFALTLSSLLLAVLAIFYTIIAAHKQDSQFSKIIDASSRLSTSVIDIERAALGISTLVKDIPEHFTEIGHKIDGISDNYKTISETERSKNLIESSTVEIDTNLNDLKSIIGTLQFSAMAVLYLFMKASSVNESIDFEDFNELEITNHAYAIGFLNGFETTNLIDFKIHEESVIPTHCESILYDNLESLLMRIVGVVSENHARDLGNAIDLINGKYVD